MAPHSPPRTALVLALALIPAPALAAPARPREAVAFVHERALDRSEFERFVGAEHLSDSDGEALLQDLMQVALVDADARRRGIDVTEKELQERLKQLETEHLQNTGGAADLAATLAEHGTTRTALQQLYRKTLLLEILVREAYSIDSRSPVPEEKMNLWLQDRVAKAVVVRTGLPEGILLQVDGESITEEAAGRFYLERLDPAGTRYRELLDQFIGIEVVEAAAHEAGIALSDADLDAALADRQRAMQQKPGFAEVTLREVLEKTGRSIEQLRQSRSFRTAIVLERLVDLRYPGATLERYYGERKADFDQRYGPTVRVRTVFLAAGSEGARATRFVKRTYGDAELELATLKQRIAEGKETFDGALARSEHPSRRDGGGLGYVGAATPNLGEVAKAALAAPAGAALLGPIREIDGVHLIQVQDRRPAPTYEQLRPLVRKQAMADLYQSLLQAAAVRRP